MIVNFVNTIIFVHLKSQELFVVLNLIKDKERKLSKQSLIGRIRTNPDLGSIWARVRALLGFKVLTLLFLLKRRFNGNRCESDMPTLNIWKVTKNYVWHFFEMIVAFLNLHFFLEWLFPNKFWKDYRKQNVFLKFFVFFK